MKLIKAIIRPNRLDAVTQALDKIGVRGMTVSEVSGYGKQRGYTETYRGSKIAINLRPKIQAEIVVVEEMLEEAVKAIVLAARTGNIGDGKIFITEIQDVVAIRTGEKGKKAL